MTPIDVLRADKIDEIVLLSVFTISFLASLFPSLLYVCPPLDMARYDWESSHESVVARAG